MITNSLPLNNANKSAVLKVGLVAFFIFVITLGGVFSLQANLTTTYSTSATPN